MLWNPEPPQGFSSEQGQVIIGRQIIPLIEPPQGISDSNLSVQGNKILAIYPPIADNTYQFYKFYQIKKGQAPIQQTNIPLVIKDTLGSGILQEPSGLDIRVFDGEKKDYETLDFTSNSFNVAFEINAPTDLRWTNKGRNLFIINLSSGIIREWIRPLGEEYTLPSASTLSDFSFNPGLGGNIQGFCFSPDETKLFITSLSNSLIKEFGLTEKGTMSIAPIPTGNEFDYTVEDSTPLKSEFSNDGKFLFMLGFSTGIIYKYSVPVPGTLDSDPILIDFFDISSFENTPNGFTLTADGKKLLLVGFTDTNLKVWTLDSEYELPSPLTAPDNVGFDFTNEDTNVRQITIKPNQETLWMVGGSTSEIYEYFIPGVPLEYESIDVNVSTGEIIIWINMTTVKDLEFIQLTFGKPSATDGSTPNAVYDANYTGVYHMNNTTFGASSVIDSTGNGDDGTPIGTGYSSVPGKIGNAIDKPLTSNNRIDLPTNSLLVTGDTEFTLTAWVNPNAFGSFNTIFGLGSIGDEVLMFLRSNAHFAFILDDFTPSFSTTSIPISIGVFTHLAVTLTNNNTLKFFINGVLVFTKSVVGNIVFVGETRHLGGDGSGEPFGGILDEMTGSNVARSDNYILTQFNNQNNNDAFWFETPLLENGEDNFLVDDMGRNIVAVET